MKILAIESNEFTARSLATVLSSQHYAVEIAREGQAGWELIEIFDYDLVVMNVFLPKLDGLSLCKRIRDRGHTMPILLLTGRDSAHERIVGLDAGADDYLIEPFDPQELLARIRALLRRGTSATLPVLTWGNLKLDPSTCEVTYSDRPLALTPKEYALLELFLRNRRRVFSCGAILEHLWAFEEIPGEYAVRTHIKELRQKLKAVGAPANTIETVYGLGYRLNQEEVLLSDPPSPEAIATHTAGNLTSTAGVWHRFKAQIHEQVDILEQAATATLQQALSQELRQQAEREANTLAGALGTFGLTEGSQLARKIERGLQAIATGLPRLSPGGDNDAMRLNEWVKALRRELGRGQPPGDFALKHSPDKRPLLLVVDCDRILGDRLVAEAEAWGLACSIAADLPSARAAIARQTPNLVLLDPCVSTSPPESFRFLTELQQRTPPISVLVFTRQDGLTDRLQVVRSGGSGFLHKPMLPPRVLKIATQVLHRGAPPTAKILVVDDDPAVLDALHRLLEPWGLQVTTLKDPRRFWETLEAVVPDLLILELRLPYISGIELCQVIRNDAQWGGLPIIFLTADNDFASLNQVFAAGADDFASKPIVGPELIGRIINRLERLRLLQRLTERESRLSDLLQER